MARTQVVQKQDLASNEVRQHATQGAQVVVSFGECGDVGFSCSHQVPNGFSACSSSSHYILNTGSIRVQIGNLKRLRILDLSRNLVTGTIPPGVGNCSVLTTVALQQNFLTGELPSELSGSSNLLDLTSVSLSCTENIHSSRITVLWDEHRNEELKIARAGCVCVVRNIKI
jgi:hypothetical protein